MKRTAFIPLIVLLGVSSYATPERAQAQEMVNRRLGADVGWWLGSVSADGRYASYVNWQTGALELLEMATGETRSLTPEADMMGRRGEAGWAEGGRLSDDGEWVAYTWFAGGCGCYQLRVVRTDGSGQRVLHANPPGPSFVLPSDWSRDGGRILAVLGRPDGSKQIVEVSADDGSLRVLKSFDWRSPGLARYSPDGQFIAYVFPPREESRQLDVFLLAVDGSRETAIVEGPESEMFLEWTPDGDALFIREDDTGTHDLWLLPLAEGRPVGEPVLIKPEWWGATYSPGMTDGGSLYYNLRVGRRQLFVADLDPASGVFTAAPTPVSGRYRAVRRFDWSPDGSRLAFVAETGVQAGNMRSQSIVIRSTANGEMRELSLDFSYLGTVRWAADGRSFVVSAREQTRGGLFRVDAQTGEVARLVTGLFPLSPSVSPDGKSVYYHCRNCPEWGVFAHDFETGRDRKLYAADAADRAAALRGDTVAADGNPIHASFQALAASPDGRQLALTSFRTEAVLLMPVAGGAPREIYRIEEIGDFDGFNLLGWTPDGEHILVTLWAQDSVWDSEATELWRISPSERTSERVATLPLNSPIQVHPDGRRIAYVAGDEKVETWVLENFLPPVMTQATPEHR